MQQEKTTDLSRKRFSNFDYVSDEITAIKRLLSIQQNDRFNFYKPKIKPREACHKLYSRNQSLNHSNTSKNSNSIQRKNEVKTVEKHYFPSKSPERKTNAPWIQNQYLKGIKSTGNIQYLYQKNAFSPKSNRFVNIYTSKYNNLSNGKYKNESLTKYL